MLKLTLPDQDDLHSDVVDHRGVLRDSALSGVSPAHERPARQQGVVASLSRALTEGHWLQQTHEELQAVLEDWIATRRCELVQIFRDANSDASGQRGGMSS